MTFDDLKTQIAAGEIDTVLTCIVDMQGRLMVTCPPKSPPL